MAFRIGQKVVCVDASEPSIFSLYRLKKGNVYIIRGFDTESRTIGLYLDGMVEPIFPPWKTETGWRITRFRPLTERKTDISTFTEMLTPQRTRAAKKELID